MIDDSTVNILPRRRFDRAKLSTDLIDALFGGDAKPRCRVLYTRLLLTSYAVGTPGELSISIKTGAEVAGMPKTTYQQVLRALKDAGWVQVERRHDVTGRDIPSLMRLVGSAGAAG